MLGFVDIAIVVSVVVEVELGIVEDASVERVAEVGVVGVLVRMN